MFKKSLMVLMVILNMILLQDAFADTFSAATPDVLIILDLSGSMNFNPQDVDGYPYGADTSCKANTTACNQPSGSYYIYGDTTCDPNTSHANPADVPPVGCGSDVVGTTYIYGSGVDCTANTNPADAAHNNIGCGGIDPGISSYVYAHDASCTESTYCRNKKSGSTQWSDCSSDSSGFCKSSHVNGTTYDCTVNCTCKDGFCKTNKTGCAVNCNCSGGYCNSAKGGCATDCSRSNCSNGFCSNTVQSDCQTNCSKIEIAKRALAALLDDAGTDNIINSDDDKSLAVRIAYMRYRDTSNWCSGGDDTGNDPLSGNIAVVQDIDKSYSQIFCGNATSCSTTVRSCGSGECIAGASPCGGTPLMRSLREAKKYLDSIDNVANTCRTKSVILITDGSDTYACGGNGQECDDESYKRRRQSVAAAKALKNAGYKVYVIGFGASMPLYLTNTLNWMAYFGGTNNPSTDEQDTGDTSAYDPTIGNTLTITDPNSCPNATGTPATTSGTCQGNNYNNWFAASNDPGKLYLSGYAFMADDADKLATYLKQIFAQIKASAYSFSQSSVQATRTKDENYIYEASFYPVDNDPFWIGHLKRYSILTDTNGNSYINSSADWDAGSQSSGQTNRNIFTYKAGTRTTFADDTNNPHTITTADLGLASDNPGISKRASIFTFFTTGETNTVTVGGGATPITYTNWMLGDIYHFSPVTIGVPNQYYIDTIDTSSGSPSCVTNSTNAYAQFYCSHTDRTSAGGKRIILAGANDGQFHAFKAAAATDGGGKEAWSFIPPNLLPNLQLIAHTTHPTTLTHTYFVDGSVGAFDVWWPQNGSNTSGTSKVIADWHTLAVMNEGRGGNANKTLWSKSSSCDMGTTSLNPTGNYPKGFYSKYKDTTVTPNVSYPNYCGYWALDVTNTTDLPTIQWRLKTEADMVAAAHLGDPWSKMVMGRVKISGNEKWVGFIGGGYSGNDCSDHTKACSDLRGKSFYVIDLKDGSILKAWTHSKDETGATGSSNNYNLDYDLAGTAGIIDTDGDGFIDAVYIGDAGGNVWRFKLCSKADGNSCKTSDWTMAKLYDTTAQAVKSPIYTIISSTAGDPNYDAAGTWWLFFGTGDSTNPNKFNTSDKLFAVKDVSRASSVVLTDLKNISTSTSTYDRKNSTDNSQKGFYINLNQTDTSNDYGEKIIANPSIFDGVLFFTTYVPQDACLLNGSAYIYLIDFNNSGTGVSGAGLLQDSNNNAVRSQSVGTGVTSSPIVSYAPNLQSVDVFVSTSQTSTSGSLTQKISLKNLFNFQKSKLLYWHDMRVQ